MLQPEVVDIRFYQTENLHGSTAILLLTLQTSWNRLTPSTRPVLHHLRQQEALKARPCKLQDANPQINKETNRLHVVQHSLAWTSQWVKHLIGLMLSSHRFVHTIGRDTFTRSHRTLQHLETLLSDLFASLYVCLTRND